MVVKKTTLAIQKFKINVRLVQIVILDTIWGGLVPKSIPNFLHPIQPHTAWPKIFDNGQKISCRFVAKTIVLRFGSQNQPVTN